MVSLECSVDTRREETSKFYMLSIFELLSVLFMAAVLKIWEVAWENDLWQVFWVKLQKLHRNGIRLKITVCLTIPLTLETWETVNPKSGNKEHVHIEHDICWIKHASSRLCGKPLILRVLHFICASKIILFYGKNKHKKRTKHSLKSIYLRCKIRCNTFSENLYLELSPRIVFIYYIKIYITYVTLKYKTSLKSLGYICSNSPKYIEWVKIIYFYFMPKILISNMHC